MKLIVSTILVLLMLISSYYSYIKEENYDLKELNLNGKVKSIREYTYEVVNNLKEIPKGEPTRSSLIIFNSEGNMIEKNLYNSNNNLQSKHLYKYDNRECLTEEIEFDSNGKPIGKYINIFDNNLNKIERIFYISDSNISSVTKTYKYDLKNNLITEIEHNTNGTLIEKHNYKYNDIRNKIDGSWEKYNQDGSLNFKVIYKYDDKGNCVEYNSYNSYGNFDSQITSNYDKKGNVLDVIWYKTDGSYDSKDTFKYDDKDNQTGMISYDSNYKDTYNNSSKYEYDKNNNWVKKLVYSNKTLSTIYIREIEYYE